MEFRSQDLKLEANAVLGHPRKKRSSILLNLTGVPIRLQDGRAAVESPDVVTLLPKGKVIPPVPMERFDHLAVVKRIAESPNFTAVVTGAVDIEPLAKPFDKLTERVYLRRPLRVTVFAQSVNKPDFEGRFDTKARPIVESVIKDRQVPPNFHFSKFFQFRYIEILTPSRLKADLERAHKKAA